MSRVCVGCFLDIAIIEKIQRNGSIGRCSFCGGDNVLTVSPESLSDLLELTVDCFTKCEDGRPPTEIYDQEFRILSKLVRSPADLWGSILGPEFMSGTYKLSSDVVEHSKEWDRFKEELVFGNRYFPQTSVFGNIFANIDSNSEGSLFLKLISYLATDYYQGEEFYRARICDHKLTSSEMGRPPKEFASSGRANPAGIAYLYLSEDRDTAIHEVRPSKGATVYVAQFTAQKNLKLVDLTDPKVKTSVLKFEENEIETVLKQLSLLELFSKDLSKPVLPEKSHLEYVPTQYVCEYFKTIAGFDGIKFASSLGRGNNLVLFDEEGFEKTDPVAYTITNTSLDFE